MKILAIIGNQPIIGAVEVYRITLPLTYLNKQRNGTRCGWMPMQRAHAHLQQNDLDTVFDNDIVVLARWLATDADADRVAQLVQALRVRGARIVYEADDDYSGKYRPAAERPGTWAPVISLVDAITVSTKPLAELVRQETNGKPVYVVPNAIEYGWFGPRSEEADRLFPELTVMLAGTKTHQEDWRVLGDVLPGILADYPGVKLLVAAPWLFDYLQDIGAEYLHPVQYGEYPGLLRQADILCAPLIPDDQFNRCKSPIKAIEGWCASRQVGKTRKGGCAIIATDCPAYRGTVQHRHNGLLVKHTPEAWDKALRALIEDHALRRKLQVEGLRDARRYDIARQWTNWQHAYREIVT